MGGIRLNVDSTNRRATKKKKLKLCFCFWNSPTVPLSLSLSFFLSLSLSLPLSLSHSLFLSLSLSLTLSLTLSLPHSLSHYLSYSFSLPLSVSLSLPVCVSVFNSPPPPAFIALAFSPSEEFLKFAQIRIFWPGPKIWDRAELTNFEERSTLPLSKLWFKKLLALPQSGFFWKS